MPYREKTLVSICRYAIDRKSDMEHYFDIDSQSGVIRTSRHLDRERNTLHNITVLATESCKSHDITHFTVSGRYT